MTVADIIQIIYIIGALMAVIFGWILKMELSMGKTNAKIEMNTELDKARVDVMTQFMADVRSELKEIHTEIKNTNDYITAQKAIKGKS